MRINPNTMAHGAYKPLRPNSGSAAEKIEQLRSGPHIKKAGDDADSVSISETMRTQIRGLNQAEQNSSGQAQIRDAEAELNETHAQLQRMRELAKQSSHSTDTDASRADLEKEFAQLKREVDRIGNTTEFNTKALLEGAQTRGAEARAARPHGPQKSSEMRAGVGTAGEREAGAIQGREAATSDNPMTRAEADRAIEQATLQMKQNSPAAMSAQANIRPESALSLIG